MYSDNSKKHSGEGEPGGRWLVFVNGPAIKLNESWCEIDEFVLWLVCIWKANLFESGFSLHPMRLLITGKETFQTKSIYVTFHQTAWELICLTQGSQTAIIVYRTEQINGTGAKEERCDINQRHLLLLLRGTDASDQWQIKVDISKTHRWCENNTFGLSNSTV